MSTEYLRIKMPARVVEIHCPSVNQEHRSILRGFLGPDHFFKMQGFDLVPGISELAQDLAVVLAQERRGPASARLGIHPTFIVGLGE